jgi:hypothetical protein
LNKEYGGVNDALSEIRDPLVGYIGASTEFLCKDVLIVKLFDTPVSNPSDLLVKLKRS